MSPAPTRYDWLYGAAAPLWMPYLAWRKFRRGKYRESTAGMLGQQLPDAAAAAPFAEGSLWLHAVSYGEVNAARAVAPHLRAIPALGAMPLVISTVTETGQAHARKSFPEATVTYFPVDYSSNVRRFQSVFNPRVFVLLETELWPNFLMLARARGTRCFMVNAKLSDRSAPRYARFRRFLAPALAALEGICVQTQLDAERFAALGIDPAHIAVTGNCKFDLEPPTLSAEERTAWLKKLGLDPARRWIVAGSTHPGEETLMLEMLRGVRAACPDVGLIVCPRHPERFNEVAALLQTSGFDWSRASAATAEGNPDVLLLDEMGVLARAYGLGTLAVVCGSFCPVGGHNLLEAAAHRIPVIFGPDLHSQREILRIFQQAEAGHQVAKEALAETANQLLRDRSLWEASAGRSRVAVEQNRGSAQRTVSQVAKWLTL